MTIRLFGCLCHVYRHVLAAKLAFVESHAAFDEREQGVILAHADVGARVHLGATLANDDVPADHSLPAELLHAEAAACRIATVARGAACFLMCHLDLLRSYSAAGASGAAAASALGAAFFAAAFFSSPPTARMRSRVSCWRWPLRRR